LGMRMPRSHQRRASSSAHSARRPRPTTGVTTEVAAEVAASAPAAADSAAARAHGNTTARGHARSQASNRRSKGRAHALAVKPSPAAAGFAAAGDGVVASDAAQAASESAVVVEGRSLRAIPARISAQVQSAREAAGLQRP
jgi:hypothetical protein